jgi:hypothetical protein
MTEAEWLACAESETLLKRSRFRNSRRKSRLFAVACCRHVWTHFVDERSRHAVEVAERHADGLATDEELRVAAHEAGEAHREMFAVLGKVGSTLEWAAEFAANADPRHAAKCAVWMVRFSRCQQHPIAPNGTEPLRLTACTVERRTGLAATLLGRWKITPLPEPVPTGADHLTLCGFIRDIFCNPFRPVTFSPEWRTDTALSLARQMYESRDFGAMPILADALQDAGCDNDDILNHCRDAKQVHVRGCWVCDLVLGKE